MHAIVTVGQTDDINGSLCGSKLAPCWWKSFMSTKGSNKSSRAILFQLILDLIALAFTFRVQLPIQLFVRTNEMWLDPVSELIAKCKSFDKFALSVAMWWSVINCASLALDSIRASIIIANNLLRTSQIWPWIKVMSAWFRAARYEVGSIVQFVARAKVKSIGKVFSCFLVMIAVDCFVYFGRSPVPAPRLPSIFVLSLMTIFLISQFHLSQTFYSV